MKAKLIAAVLVVCAAAVGIVAWRAGPKTEPATPARADRGERAAATVPANAKTASTTIVEPTASTPAEGARMSVSVAADGLAPASPARNPKVVIGRPRPEEAKPYHAAEPIDDAEHGALRVIVTPPPGVPPSDIDVGVTLKFDGVRYETAHHHLGLDGRLEVRGLPPGRGSVSATLSRRHRSTSVDVEAGRFVEVEIGFQPGATVTGVVRHTERGPLADLSLGVRAKNGAFEESISARTDAGGRYRLDGVPVGTHPVTLSGKLIGFRNLPHATLAVPGLAPVVRDFVLGRVRLRGVVRQAGTGRPLPGVRVELQRKGGFIETTTNAAGAYAFHDVLAADDYRLFLTRDGYGRGWIQPVTVPAEGAATRDAELVPGAVLILEVRDSSGQPVPGRHSVGLSLVESTTSFGGDIEFDAGGMGRYTRIVPGAYWLTLGVDGYFPCRKRVELAAGENRVSVRLEPTEVEEEEEQPVALQGTVREAGTGKPLPGVRVRIRRAYGADVRTDAKGIYRFRGSLRGKYEIIVSRDGYGVLFARDVEVTMKPTTHDFEMVRAATLHLYVTDRSNRPVVGRLHLSVRGGGEGTTRVGTSVQADADGHGVYRQIVPGMYELRVSADGIGEAKVTVKIAPGENTVRVRLE